MLVFFSMSEIKLIFWREFSPPWLSWKVGWEGHFYVLERAWCFLLWPHLLSHLFALCGLLLPSYSSNVTLPSGYRQKSQILLWTDRVFLFFTQIMRNSEYVKIGIKNFIANKDLFSMVCTFLLQRKNWKRWTQFLLLNMNHCFPVIYTVLWNRHATDYKIP